MSKATKCHVGMCEARGKWVPMAMFSLTLQLVLCINLASVSPRKQERLGCTKTVFSVLSAKKPWKGLDERAG